MPRWKNVSGYLGLYQVSDSGLVKSLDRIVAGKNNTTRKIRGKQLAPVVNNRGYLLVGLWKTNQERNCTVHSLVANAFLGTRPFDMEISHKNNRKTDNRASNLKYTTHFDNIQQKKNHGTNQEGESNHRAKLTAQDVAYIRASEQPARNLANMFGVSRGHIYDLRAGRYWQCLK